MKINRKKLELAKARACMGQKEIVAAGFPAGTLTNAMTGKNIKPETAGRLAKVLGVDVLEIIETEEQQQYALVGGVGVNERRIIQEKRGYFQEK